MQIGCHVSIAGSIDKAIDNAVERECSAFQIFTRNPRGWHAKELTKEDIANFKSKLKASKIDRLATCAHMPYLPNLATPKQDGFEKSLKTLIDEIERCVQLGIPYLVTHLGSHLGTGDEAGIKKLVEGLTIAGQTKNDVIILLENTAGQKNSVGSNFKQLGEIFNQLKPAKKFGVCFDSCHAFVAGYDLRTEERVKETFDEFDKYIGIENLKILHLNDAKGDIGCNLDRHYHLGLGGIGEKGIAAVIKFANKREIPIILETPIDDDRDDFENIRKAKEFA
ncbi:deoxyribonuclease IV [Marine Group I thaumarchaeote]|jgi:deoxyribonuclease-4|uniref:Probable endonuclease 4 n=1 Tax=Marine Group I thaumarchaeote TaxID=2511932 RepID=A0A7K4M8Z6_9ARCH|nr:deoxyribonuclease IV [Candidatus Nitrosopumilus sp. MTA1]NWJ20536.1 deoxyribonuclease IV [Marine Group I thaumarchaeote]NWJ28658.1 deoxyribonuclease IV [Marine Group I thaumarchaeote]NWJ29342.1 deoxyribonuclease IV [Marine Group I thaumarchaeote]NWJ56557.1 deoxyribonuclease IV [Marine Group I thaumarchaeote]